MWWALIKYSFLALMLMGLGSCQKVNSNVVKVYLASSLLPLEEDFKNLASDLDLVFLSSSAIAKQIKAGAPCDIAIFADNRWHDELIAHGLIEKDVRMMASNNLVLASTMKVGSSGELSEALQQIEPTERLIVGDPDFVPLGLYTKHTLKNLKLFEKLSARMFRAHSARHATMLLKNGAAKYAILYESDVINDNLYVLSRIASSLHPPIEYPLVICKNHHKKRVSSVIESIFSDAWREKLAKKGFVKINLER